MMDLRERKTKRAIKDAFLQMRAKKPLEKMTIKELSELAEISKATFYLHYKDIYDLSDQLQNEVVQDIMGAVSHDEAALVDMEQMAKKLYVAFCSHRHLTDILFSGNQASALPGSIEQGIKDCIFRIRPELKEDAVFNVLLSYQIQGGFYAYMENRRLLGDESILYILDELSRQLKEFQITRRSFDKIPPSLQERS